MRKLEIGPRRVEQVIYQNKAFVSEHMAWPKTRRIFLRQRIATRLEGVDHKDRDETDALDALQKEIEGNRPVIDQSQHMHMMSVTGLVREINLEPTGDKSTDDGEISTDDRSTINRDTSTEDASDNG